MISINNKSPLFLEACKKDENDQLNHFKDKFHIPRFKKKKNYIYFAGNSLGLQPKNAEKYILEELNEWKTLGGGKFDSSKINDVMGGAYGDMMNKNPNISVSVEGQSPDFLKKDYRAVMKAIDKKQGK